MRIVAVLAVAGTALAACGGSGGASRPKLVAQRSTTTTAAATPTTTVVAAAPPAGAAGQPPPAGPATTPAGGGGAGGPTPVTPPQGPGPAQPVTATLDKQCVHRGSPAEQQGFTAHLAARSAVGYDTIYSDNSNEMTNRGYTTGFGYGKSEDSGTYHTSWVVPATAPPGTAKLYVLYSGDKPPIVLPFTIVTETGKCP